MPVKGQQKTPQVLPAGSGPSLAASLSFPQQHSHSWGTDRHTALLLPWHSLLSCPGEAMVSNPVTPRKAAHGQKQSQLQAGPQPTLPACNNCDTQSQEPSAD